MTGMTLRVGKDLDGVQYDFAASVRATLLAEGYPAWKMTDPQRWEFYLDWGLTTKEFLAVCHRGVDAGIIFRQGGALPGVADAARRIKAAGHEIHVVTDRTFGSPGASERNTIEWAAEVGCLYDSIHFSPDKTIVATDVFVEDKLSNYDDLTAAGTMTFLIDRPWNQVPGGDNRRRIASITEFADTILSPDFVLETTVAA
jgi:hypothetical protein